MQRTIVMLAIALLAYSPCLQSQLPFAFIEKTRSDEYGSIHDVAFRDDGIVFVAHGNRGIRAYRYNGSACTLLASTDHYSGTGSIALGPDDVVYAIDTLGLRAYRFVDNRFEFLDRIQSGEGSWSHGVTVGPDGTIFLAYGRAGIHAFRFDGISFSLVGRVNSGGIARRVAVGDNGAVFLANDDEGLRVYRFDGASFELVTHRSDGGKAVDVVEGAGGMVFLANEYHGLRAYRFIGDTLELLCTYKENGCVEGVAIDANGTVFVADFLRGLQALVFNGSEFTRIGQVNDDMYYAQEVAVHPDGTVFLSSVWHGMRAYCFRDGEFSLVAHVHDGGDPQDLVVIDDSTVILANGYEGLRAYRVNEDTLVSIAHIDDGGNARTVVVTAEGKVILASSFAGIRVYTYSEPVFHCSAYHPDEGISSVCVGPGNVIFAAGIKGLQAFRDLEDSLTLLSEIKTAQAIAITVGPDGIVYLADQSEGLAAFGFDGANFRCLARVNPGGWAQDVAIDTDGTVFLGTTWNGLYAFRFTGSDFLQLAHVEDFATGARDICIGDNGTVFLASNRHGLLAFRFDGSSFRLLAHLSDRKFHQATGVKLGIGNTVFLAVADQGLFAFEYLQLTGTPVTMQHPVDIRLEQNHPNPFNPSTTIRYTLDKPQRVTLIVTDRFGREVRRLLDGSIEDTGTHQLPFEAGGLPSGVYFYSLIAEGKRMTRRMVVLK